MGDFKRGRFGGNRGGGGFGGGRPSFPKKSWGGQSGRDRGPVTLHQAVCAQCGKSCEVPFRPTSDKPVYCNACFGGKKEFGDSRESRYQAPARPEFTPAAKGADDEVKKQLELLNAKMDRLIKAVETMAMPAAKEVSKPAAMPKAKKAVSKKAKK